MLVGMVIAGLFIYECIGSKIGPQVPSTVTIGLASSVQIVYRIQTNPWTPKNESFYKAPLCLSWGHVIDHLVSLNVKPGWPCTIPEEWPKIWVFCDFSRAFLPDNRNTEDLSFNARTHILVQDLFFGTLQTLGRAQCPCKSNYATWTNSTMDKIEFYENWNEQSLTLLQPKWNKIIFSYFHVSTGFVSLFLSLRNWLMLFI